MTNPERPHCFFVNRYQFYVRRWLIVVSLSVLTLCAASQQTSQAGVLADAPKQIIADPVLSFSPIWFSSAILNGSSLAWGDVDGDGDLDLAADTKLYLNESGKLQTDTAWVAVDNTIANDTAHAMAWGDVDNDNDLDLVVSNSDATKLYINEGGVLHSIAAWIAAESDNSIAWGDVDGDGDYDLAAGTGFLSNKLKIYFNSNGQLEERASWVSNDSFAIHNIAWGDVDGDGALDMAVGGSPTWDYSCSCYTDSGLRLYRNKNGSLQPTATWTATLKSPVYGVAWGDVDNDNDLDLIANSLLYQNDNGVLGRDPIWSPRNDSNGQSTWVDADGDGDLDLFVSGQIYLNKNGRLDSTPAWIFKPGSMGAGVAWGDVDNDGDLDLAASGLPGILYINNSRSTLSTVANWTSPNDSPGAVTSMAWGDVDNDSDLDLAVGFGSEDNNLKLYLNIGNTLETTATWVSANQNFSEGIQDIFWIDTDGDGDLDLSVENDDSPVELYQNDQGNLQKTPVWKSEETDYSASSIAWGDIDNDGDLDLAVGNYSQEGGVKLYLNREGKLSAQADWTSNRLVYITSVSWGDIDNDGDLDLAVGATESGYLFLNNNGFLQLREIRKDKPWKIKIGDIRSLAWGDVDGDDDLDLAAGNYAQPDKLYLNGNGNLAILAGWSPANIDDTFGVSWADIDGDGDLDLTARGSDKLFYINEKDNLNSLPVLGAIGDTNFAWGDVDSDGDLDLAAGDSQFAKVYLNYKPAHPAYPLPKNRLSAISINLHSDSIPTFNGQSSTALAPADFYAIPGFRGSGTIPITYTLFSAGKDPVRAIHVYYSLDGSFSGDRSQWRIAKPAPGTQTTNLTAGLYPTKTVTNTHVFHWDVYGSGFFGQSDNVVVRIEALPNLKPIRNGVPGPFQRAYVSTQTFPFRVRGNQVRVLHSGTTGTAAPNSVIYRVPANQPQLALPYVDNSGKLLHTNPQGYLQGRGRLDAGDRLFALAPITATEKYTVYHTSAVVNANGLEPFTVTANGIQTLTVSSANTFILYNLVVSLEWDARNDPTFMTQLENDLRRTSQILFDLTNGQAALGDVRIYHDKGFWGTADVVITASNNQRPNAILGGSVLTATGDVDIQGKPIVDAYVPGQVRMGATWNRFGNPNGTLGEDWPRTLAHELGHYLFFVPDNYIGVTPDRQFIQIIDCQGSVMTDPYEESYSEFLTADQWQTDACQRSVAAVYLGRPDWATITRFYPMLNGRGGNPGPAQLPLAVTRITTFAPPRPATALAAPFFPLVNQQGQTISVPDSRGQAYLFKTGIKSDPTDDYVIALGTPIGDLVQARGATPGDRLCVFDFAHQPLRLGCLASVGSAPAPITLAEVPDWSPQVQVSGVTTNTVIVTVTNVNVDNLAVQLLPALGVASAEIPMTRQGDAFVQTVTAADGAYFGFVRIWAPGSDPLKEIIVDYSANEAWDGHARAWGSSGDGWGGHARAWGGRAYGWGGRARAWGAPVMSNDGQVSIFPLDNPFAGGAHYTLQSVIFPPSLPTWLTPVGQAYRVVSDGTLARSAILFSYLGRDVPDGYENLLTIYYSPDEGRNWQRLPTDLDVNRNQASAPVMGEGIYLLVVTVPVTPALTAGWNTIGYPVQASQPISPALASIAQKYSIVYHYQTTPSPTWQTFAPAVPAPFAAAVNDLTHLEFGRAYWLYATEAVTLYLGVESQFIASSNASAAANAPTAPATYYGWVVAAPNFTPFEGMRVRAEIDGVVCGETAVQLFNGQPGYVLRVAATDLQSAVATCGQGGKTVKFVVGDVPMAQSATWNNQSAWNLSLSTLSGLGAIPPHSAVVYLPLIRR